MKTQTVEHGSFLHLKKGFKVTGPFICRKERKMASSVMIRPIDQFDANSVAFSNINKNEKGGKAVYLSLPGKQKLLFQLPVMRAPFGLSNYVDKTSGKSSYSLSLDLANHPEIAAQFRAFDDKVVDFAVANSDALLGKRYTREVIREALYKSPLRKDKDGKYADTLYLKVMTTRDEKSFAVEAYESNKKPTDLSSLDKGRYVVTIFVVSQVWVVDNKFGVSVRLMQIMFAPKTELRGFSFVGVEDIPAAEGEDEDEEMVADEDV